MDFHSGYKYRRDDWFIEVYYDGAGQLVARTLRSDDVVPVDSLPQDGWVRVD